MFDTELHNAVEAGLASLRAISRQIAPRGVGLTIIRLGPTETGMGGTGSPAALKTGEIGDAVVAIASLPKRVWMEEITLAALDNKVE